MRVPVTTSPIRGRPTRIQSSSEAQITLVGLKVGHLNCRRDGFPERFSLQICRLLNQRVGGIVRWIKGIFDHTQSGTLSSDFDVTNVEYGKPVTPFGSTLSPLAPPPHYERDHLEKIPAM